MKSEMRGPNKGSLIAKVEPLSVGERVFVESSFSDFKSVMRRVTASSRFPESMRGRKYSCALYRALGESATNEVIFLVAVTRIE